MVKGIFLLIPTLACLFIMSPHRVYAQQSEGPPNEAPFVDVEKEFEQSTDQSQGELGKKGDSNLPKSTPAATPTSAPTASGVKLLPHPLTKKGLAKIEADGTYVYKIKPGVYNKAGLFRIGFIDAPRIEAKDGVATYADIYGDKRIPTVMFDFEWHPFDVGGKWGIQAGLGFFTSNGNGRFVQSGTGTAGRIPKEKFNFFAFPLNMGLVYRLELMKRQWVAPFVCGGGTYYFLAEKRNDRQMPKVAGSPAVYGGGGILFNLSALDNDLAFTLHEEYGVGNMWLDLELRYQQSLSQDLDFSSTVLALGFAMDY